ncbi:unnamed protein product [Closterium sp. Naga37s-1]|nr:unnamed protein product [Closterium sp. Naga37s-1]
MRARPIPHASPSLPLFVLSPSPSHFACSFPLNALTPPPPSLSLPFLVAFSPLPPRYRACSPPRARSPHMRSLHFPATLTQLPHRVLSHSSSLACSFPFHGLPPLPPSLSLPFLVAFSPHPPLLACSFPPNALTPTPPSLSLPFLVAFSPLPPR